MILKLRYFPKKWKESHLCVIPKQGTFPENYRLISLLVEQNSRRNHREDIQENTEILGIIPDEQYEFRRQQSMEQQALRLVNYAYNKFHRKIAGTFSLKMMTGIIFLDVAKAFGRM